MSFVRIHSKQTTSNHKLSLFVEFKPHFLFSLMVKKQISRSHKNIHVIFFSSRVSFSDTDKTDSLKDMKSFSFSMVEERKSENRELLK